MNDKEEKDKRTYSEKLTQLHGVILDASELSEQMIEEVDSSPFILGITTSLKNARSLAVQERWRIDSAKAE